MAGKRRRQGEAARIETIAEFEQLRTPCRPEVQREHKGNNRPTFYCPCGGPAPIYATDHRRVVDGKRVYWAYRRCDDCGRQFVLADGQVVDTAAEAGAKAEAKARARVFLSLHWLLISTTALNKAQVKAGLKALRRAKKKCGVLEEGTFKPLSKPIREELHRCNS